MAGEVSLSLDYGIAGPLYVFVNNYVEIIEDNGGYSGELGLGIEHEFSEKASFEASASMLWATAQYNDYYFGVDKNALNTVLLSFSLTLEPIKHLTVRPHVEISSIIDDEIGAANDDSTLVNTGVAVGIKW